MTVVIIILLVTVFIGLITGIGMENDSIIGATAAALILLVILGFKENSIYQKEQAQFLSETQAKLDSNEYSVYYDNIEIDPQDITDLSKYRIEIFDQSHKIVLSSKS